MQSEERMCTSFPRSGTRPRALAGNGWRDVALALVLGGAPDGAAHGCRSRHLRCYGRFFPLALGADGFSLTFGGGAAAAAARSSSAQRAAA